MASGLPPDIVERIIEAEKIPLKTLEGTKGKQEAKLKLVTDLTDKVSNIRKNIGELAGSKGFMDYKVDTGDPNILTGTADPASTVTGSWAVEVMSLASKPAAITNGFPDKDKTELGVGYLKFETKDGPREVYLNGKANTLEGAAAAINSANIGARASVIEDRKNPDSPFRLVIAGMDTGGDKEIKFPTVYLLDGDQDVFFEDTRPAQNAKLKIDGFEVEVPENQVKDLIPGITLDLKQAVPGRTIHVTVKENMEVVSGKVKSFVDSVNEVFSFIQNQNKMNEKTDTTKTLGGDSLLRSIEQRFHRVMQNTVVGVGGNLNRLSQLGIQFNRSGTLDFDQQKFNSALASRPKDVQNFLAGDGFSVGFIPVLKREIAAILDAGFGPLGNRKKGLENRIDTINKQLDNKERSLQKREDSLRQKFSKLEETMSKLNSQGSAVKAIGGGGGGIPQGQG